MSTGLIAPTTDLYDVYGESLEVCDLQFRQFGARSSFQGPIVTFKSHEDNLLLKAIVAEPGRGRVLVVDTGGSLHVAMIGDNMAATAAENGWAGIIVNGAVRDVTGMKKVGIGIKALGTNPRRSRKEGAGQRDIPVTFGGALFSPGGHLVSDDDGLVVVAAPTG